MVAENLDLVVLVVPANVLEAFSYFLVVLVVPVGVWSTRRRRLGCFSCACARLVTCRE